MKLVSFHLPKSVYFNLLKFWLENVDLRKFDSAICNYQQREFLLNDVFADPYFIIEGYPHPNFFKPECQFYDDYINWFTLRKIKFRIVCLNGKKKYNGGTFLYSYLSHIVSPKYINFWDCSKVTTLIIKFSLDLDHLKRMVNSSPCLRILSFANMNLPDIVVKSFDINLMHQLTSIELDNCGSNEAALIFATTCHNLEIVRFSFLIEENTAVLLAQNNVCIREFLYNTAICSSALFIELGKLLTNIEIWELYIQEYMFTSIAAISKVMELCQNLVKLTISTGRLYSPITKRFSYSNTATAKCVHFNMYNPKPENIEMTDKDWKVFFRTHTNFNIISLKKIEHMPRDDVLMRITRDNPNLTSIGLCVSVVSINPLQHCWYSLEAIRSLLVRCKLLDTLDLTGCNHFTTEQLLDLFKTPNSLTHLYLERHNTLTTETTNEIKGLSKTLRRIEIGWCTLIDPRGVRAAARGSGDI